jgi:hypothetical protein
MVTFMMEISLREKNMEKVVYFLKIKNLNLKGIGLMMKKMDTELRIFPMEQNMKDFLKKGKKTEKVNINIETNKNKNKNNF